MKSTELTADAYAPTFVDSDAVSVPPLEREKPRTRRVPSIDRLRGIVIALMALDHVRDFFTNAHFSPTDLQHTTPALFFTRWITHYCAPTFIFLAGVSAQQMSARMSRLALQRFLLTRGLWLIALEFTVVMFVWMFNVSYPLGLVMQVIWATGFSMCALAALVSLPARWVGAFGVAMIASHNLLDGIRPESFGTWAPLWRIVHVEGETPFGVVVYPVVPWIGVMAVGYGFGEIYRLERARRLRTLVYAGLGLCAAFIFLRAINLYGDPRPWSQQRDLLWTSLAFLDVTKYPPSLAYVLMTLGPAMLVLALLERTSSGFAKGFETFGRVPMFAYVVHLAIAHLFAGLLGALQGHGSTILTTIFVFYPKNWGVGLLGVYFAWLLVLACLYPLCHWFGGVKRRRSDWWLSYL
ncbi:MAG TPA: heparan-alpha-glucosaminide N-acetyltransferase domain-containing protein [Polyangiales bacterium]|nr:heparan-alpha-glucosaminide N-acetyltransferase domain-containing protein [Polyangiales bacterium]